MQKSWQLPKTPLTIKVLTSFAHLSRRRGPHNTPHSRLFVSPFKFMGVWHRPMGVSSQALGSSPWQCWSVRSDSPSSSWLSLCFKIGEFVREVSAAAWPPPQPSHELVYEVTPIFICVPICLVEKQEGRMIHLTIWNSWPTSSWTQTTRRRVTAPFWPTKATTTVKLFWHVTSWSLVARLFVCEMI